MGTSYFQTGARCELCRAKLATPHTWQVVLSVALFFTGRFEPRPLRKVFHFFPGFFPMWSLGGKSFSFFPGPPQARPPRKVECQTPHTRQFVFSIRFQMVVRLPCSALPIFAAERQHTAMPPFPQSPKHPCLTPPIHWHGAPRSRSTGKSQQATITVPYV